MATSLLQSLAIAVHVAVVFLKSGREHRLALGIFTRSDEIEVVGLGWIHGRSQRGDSGICDRPGRQAGMYVGVIRSIALQVAGIDGAAPLMLQLESIDDRGIGHQ